MISSKAYLSNGVLIETSQPKVQLAPPKQMNFRKSSERGGEGGIFNPKIMLQILDLLNRVFEHEIWFKKLQGEGGSKIVWNCSENSFIVGATRP